MGVMQHRDATVGKPTDKEAREALVEVKGVVFKAITKIFQQRYTKVRICMYGNTLALYIHYIFSYTPVEPLFWTP